MLDPLREEDVAEAVQVAAHYGAGPGAAGELGDMAVGRAQSDREGPGDVVEDSRRALLALLEEHLEGLVGEAQQGARLGGVDRGRMLAAQQQARLPEHGS